MRLVRLGLHDFRCYHEATLDLAPGVTLVVGGNVTENIDSARLRSALKDMIKG